MVEPNHIHARQDFARRLRELRVPRGFKTARSLARALEIDENRYTRYERAEVEPDLALIRRICETLRVTPNELLGTPSAAAGSTSEPAGGLPGDGKAAGIDDGPRSISLPEGAVAVASPFSVRVDTAAWSLACAVAELKDGACADGAVQSLAVIQRATHF
jgi:transcriptional regulator with XRE-family HTH domain